ncbi:helix-turn-helix domain-containing protein [Candidatus Avelusimicrobium stercoris]|uniref:helix-turn-helix domain-containing protein n=1 Tax=Candidatus Avelusimicrobium stercoris TaxID=1947924 RepID=UPI003D151485
MKNTYAAADKKYLKAFGAHVRALRKAAGFSQEDFALEIGLDRTYMGGVERGERNLALLNLRKIAKGLKISVSELLAFPAK